MKSVSCFELKLQHITSLVKQSIIVARYINLLLKYFKYVKSVAQITLTLSIFISFVKFLILAIS
jgi:hypothetical protein